MSYTANIDRQLVPSTHARQTAVHVQPLLRAPLLDAHAADILACCKQHPAPCAYQHQVSADYTDIVCVCLCCWRTAKRPNPSPHNPISTHLFAAA